MAKRADFGDNWEEIVQDWCLGSSPAIAPQVGWDALGVLERLWSQRLDEVLNSSARGSPIVVALVDDGLTIAACENLTGFNRVFKRWKEGERGARSELRFAATLLALGHRPTLEPSVKGKVLDAVISLANQNVYFEVATPEFSDAVQQAWQRMNTLATRLTNENPGTSISVYLVAEPTAQALHKIAEKVPRLTPTDAGTLDELSGIAHLRCATVDAELGAFDPLHGSDELPRLVVASAARREGAFSRADVKLPITDDRAERLMHKELSHFARRERNVLVLNISRVIGALKRWEPLVKRRLQPKMNRRCGAVALLSTVGTVSPPAVELKSLVVRNQYAYVPVPAPLLKQLGALPNWWQT